MKKLLLGLILAIGLISCNKEVITPAPNPQNCNCGVITNDGITDGCYWLEIRNDCSGNKKTFCFDADVWYDAYPGSSFCVTNQPSW